MPKGSECSAVFVYSTKLLKINTYFIYINIYMYKNIYEKVLLLSELVHSI